MELDLTPNLTKPSSTEMQRLIARTHRGMAHWGGSGPDGKTCRECAHWKTLGDRYAKGGKHNGVPKASICDLFKKFSMGKQGDKVPHNAAACKYFEQSEKAMPIFEVSR